MQDILICFKSTGRQLLLIGNGDYWLLIQTVFVFSLYTGSVKMKVCLWMCMECETEHSWTDSCCYMDFQNSAKCFRKFAL